MLIFGADIDDQRAGRDLERSTGMAIRTALKRTAEVVGNGLPEMIAVGQGRSADRYRPNIKRIDVRGEVVAAAEQSYFVAKLPLQFFDEPGSFLVRRVDCIQNLGRFFREARAFHPRPRL